ncbi:neprilysin-1 isoform X2 [Dermacentor silvarum]|nr:neprilysin-1 isoform X2 [Dermacentor silvarum]
MCMAVACGGLALAFVLMRQQVKLDAERLTYMPPCGTEDCREQAARLARRIDASREPCDDLYAYTCGAAGVDTARKRWLLTPYLESVKGMIHRGLVPADRNSSSAAYKAYSAFNACLSRPTGVGVVQPFVEFMSARKIPWPRRPPEDADPLDVLVDLAVNWRVPLLFDVRVVYTNLDNPLVVAIDAMGYVTLLRMEQLSACGESGGGEYDELLRSVAGYLRQDALLSDEECLVLRLDETSVRSNVTSAVRIEEEEEEDDVFVASLNDSLSSSEIGQTWLTLLQRHLGSDVQLSPATKLQAHSERHFYEIVALLEAMPRERLLNVIGWTFAYSYLWIVNPDLDHFRPGKECDVFDGQAACFLTVQESFGTVLVAPQFLGYFQQDRQATTLHHARRDHAAFSASRTDFEELGGRHQAVGRREDPGEDQTSAVAAGAVLPYEAAGRAVRGISRDDDELLRVLVRVAKGRAQDVEEQLLQPPDDGQRTVARRRGALLVRRQPAPSRPVGAVPAFLLPSRHGRVGLQRLGFPARQGAGQSRGPARPRHRRHRGRGGGVDAGREVSPGLGQHQS